MCVWGVGTWDTWANAYGPIFVDWFTPMETLVWRHDATIRGLLAGY